MHFFATVLTVALATLLMSSGAAVAPGYRMGSCSFGYNNVYYMFGGAVCTTIWALGQTDLSLPPHLFLLLIFVYHSLSLTFCATEDLQRNQLCQCSSTARTSRHHPLVGAS